MAIAAFVVSIVAALAAVVAVVYARRLDGTARQAVAAARESAAAGGRSAVASEERARLEAGRRHDELMPRFRVSVKETGIEKLLLTVFLAGPAALEAVDALTVTIRNDHARHGSWLLPGSMREQAAQIWGPYRFSPGATTGGEVTDPTGRTTVPADLPVGESLMFYLERSMGPKWLGESPDSWRRRMGTILRLQLDCSRKGWDPWTLKGEIDTARGTVTVNVP